MFDLKKVSFVVIIPVLLIALLVIYFIGKNSGKAKALAADSDTLNKDINESTLTFPLSTYKQMADTLYTAMVDPGTDFDTVFNVLSKIENQSDLFQLDKSFGTRSSYTILWVITPFTGTLSQWLSDELDDDEKAQVNQLLSTKNITFII